jgi:hypothetical protein
MMKITGRISLLAIALTVALACASAAKADTFTFTFTGVDVSDNAVGGTLTLATTSLGGGYYGITGVSGILGPSGGLDTVNDTLSYDWDGTANYGVIHYTAAGTGVEYDNILNLSGAGPIFDSHGLYMPYLTTTTTPEGPVATIKDIYFYSSGDIYNFEHFKNNAVDDNGTFMIASESESSSITPEPSTWLLLGSGLFALAGWRGRAAVRA